MKLQTFCFSLIATCAIALCAEQGHSHLGAAEQVGTVNFPVSCNPSVQKSFEHGIALMHSFEYEPAQNQFKEVAKQDPTCAMAYWGEALSLYHQLWGRPSNADLKLGNELLTQTEKLRPKTERERGYVDALAVFYRDSDKIDHPQRADAYAAAMQAVSQYNPQDREAAIFYALSLLASGPENDPERANAKKAVAILNPLFEQDPLHPGIAHYIIHACDNPQMANMGLAAARKYASIAPSSPHAVHMPSHIFARLGLWQDDIASNTAAIAAADKMQAMHLHAMHHRVHSMDFLEYAYLQVGDDAKALEMMNGVVAVNREEMGEEFLDYYDSMRAGFAARYALERRQWQEALALQPLQGARASVQSLTYWAHAVAAGHMHDAATAQSAVDQFDALLEATRKSDKPYYANGMANNQNEAEAWLAFAQGRNDEAVRLLRTVADKQDKVGKGETETPAREMLADMLLEMNRPQEALKEYEVALKTDPNRFNGLYGAARAAETIHEKEKAQDYYARLIRNCQNSNSDRSELAKAKQLLAVK